MEFDHRTPSPHRGTTSDRDSVGMPVLLLAALAAVMAVVASVWALSATSAMWAVSVAMIVALAAMLGVIAVINHQLGDVDGEPPS